MKTKTTRLLLFMLFCIGSVIAFGQEKMTVSGAVKDSIGKSLEGATVTEKGTSNRTMTNNAGNFSIKVKSGAKLVISFVGYSTEEVPAEPGSAMSITLGYEKINSTNEVVVTALGIKKQSKALGYAVSKVGSDRIMASGSPTNDLQSLYGAAPGVSVAGTAAGP